MGEVNPEESLEISRGVFKRLGDCTGLELESAIRLIAQKRIDRAWIADFELKRPGIAGVQLTHAGYPVVN